LTTESFADHTFMHTVYYILLLLLMLVGLFVNIMGLPGLWLMVISYVGYALATGWDTYVGWPSITVLVLLGLGAELVEFLAGAAGSAAAGGRKRGMLGAVVGAVIGGIVGTPILPIVGTIVGACAGAFVGAAAMEFTDKDAAHAYRVGIGAFKGRFWGIVWKSAFGLLMFFVAAIAGIPMSDGVTVSSPAAPRTTPSPATLPTTIPATAPTASPTTLP
jgi:uncharacterized protein YqgC (DUF456 family)